MLFNTLQLILNCKKVFTDLSIKEIQKTVDEVFVNGLEPLKETIANPIFGFFADKTGLIYNIRFFSPYIKAIDENRQFIADESKDPITSLIIKLYPSPAGQLTTSTAHFSNPLKLFENNKKESVKFFARLFTAVLNDRIGPFTFKFHSARGEGKIEFNKRCEIFNKLKQLFFDKKADSIFKDKTIKLFLIHSYLINVLDPYVQGEGEDYFKFYLTEIANSYRFYLKEAGKGSRYPKKNKFLEIKVDNEVLQSAFDYYESLNSFPYSFLNKPESSKYIPSYIRSKDTFSKDDKFSDCADIALLHLCNCLFFYKGKYRIDHLPKASSHLNSFYKKYDKIYNFTMEIRKEWSKVIQDLNEEEDDNSIYPTKNVLYVNKTIHNEVNPGIINMMNILIRITGLRDEMILEDINAVNIEEKLVFLINRLSLKEKRDGANLESVAKVTFKGKIEEFDTRINGKKDFLGTFNIDFNYSGQTSKTIVVYQGDSHAAVELPEEKIKPFFTDEEKNNLKRKLASPNYKDLIFKCLLFPEDKDLDNSEENELNKLFITGRIDNNSSSVKILNRICIFASTINDTKMIDKVEKIISLILGKVDLSDDGTRDNFKIFLCFKISAIKNDELNDFIEYYFDELLSYPIFLRSKWEQFFSKHIPALEKLYLKNLRIPSHFFNSFIQMISKFTNLKELKLENFALNKEALEEIIENLKFPEKITNLDLLLNEGLTIPKNIKMLTNLKKLNVSWCEMKSISDSICFLSSLEELHVSGNKGLIIPENIQNLTSLKKLDVALCEMKSIPDSICFLSSLEDLNFSMNKGPNISENIKYLTSLKKLNISFCELNLIPDSIFLLNSLDELHASGNKGLTIPKKIKMLTNLKKLNISFCELNSIPDSICFLSLLEDLNFSRNLGLIIPENIQNLTSLKKLNVARCELNLIPDSIFLLNSLEELDASGNKGPNISENIKFLTSLKKLNVSFCELNSIPDSIFLLNSLEELDASGNKGLIIPENIQKLSKLRVLKIEGTGI